MLNQNNTRGNFMSQSSIKEKESNSGFMSQVESVQTFLSANVRMSPQHYAIYGSFQNPVSIAKILYCYILCLAFDVEDFNEATLEIAMHLSDGYNQSIIAYLGKSLEQEKYETFKSIIFEEGISREVLQYVIEDECSNYESATPDSIVSLALKLLDIKEGETVVDVGSGSGNFILNGAVANPKSVFTGYEINTELYLVSLMRNYSCNGNKGDSNVNLLHADAFDIVDIKKEIRFDKVFANYPIGMQLKFSGIGQSYMMKINDRLGLPYSSISGDWLFNLLIRELTEKSPDGKAIGIMAGGSSWNLTDRFVRKYFLDLGIVECVIALPPKLFGTTGIPMMMIMFSFGNLKVRMIDATQFYVPGRRQNSMDMNQIHKVLEALHVDSEYSKLVEYEEMEQQDYTLDPGRYLGQKKKIENGVAFGSVIKSITRGAQKTAKELDELVSQKATNINYLMLSDIHNGLINEELSSLTKLDPSLEKYCLKDNDLILSKNGYPYKVAIAHPKPGQKILANGNLYIIELDQERINPLYLKAFLESEVGINLLKSITVGVAIPNLGVVNLKKMIIPVPPMEQQNLVAEKYLAQLDEIKILKIKLDKAIKRLGEIF